MVCCLWPPILLIRSFRNWSMPCAEVSLIRVFRDTFRNIIAAVLNLYNTLRCSIENSTEYLHHSLYIKYYCSTTDAFDTTYSAVNNLGFWRSDRINGSIYGRKWPVKGTVLPLLKLLISHASSITLQQMEIISFSNSRCIEHSPYTVAKM